MAARYFWTKELPQAWKDAGLSYAVADNRNGGTAEWYVCACRDMVTAYSIAETLNLRDTAAG